MKTSIKIKVGLLSLLVVLYGGCNNFLDVDRPDNLVKNEFWQSSDHAFSSLMGLYTSLNSSLNYLHVWGDIRSSLYAPGRSSSFSGDYSEFLMHDIYPTNSLVSWAQVYKSIGWVNSFLINAPLTLDNDPTFKQNQLDEMLGEAHAIRALYYFYLVRAFKEVPIIKEAYESDMQKINTAVSTEQEVLDFIEEDLDIALRYVPESYANQKDTFGRITKNAVRAIWADVKLWRNQYQECIDLCVILDSKYLNSLVSPHDWYTIFNPGNSSESIFEYQYSQIGPSSPLYNWFSYHDRSGERYLANASNVRINSSEELYPPVGLDPTLYTTSDTIRLKTYSAFNMQNVSTGYGTGLEVYKFLGEAPYQRSYRSSNNRTANYIFYRYREILFMKAEALAMQGDYLKAEEELNIIREHCDIPPIEPGGAGDGAEFFANLLMEREFELGFEGKEWFAAVRIARRPGFESVLIEKASMNHSMGRPYQVIRARLLNPESWFLPYYYDEVEKNQQLDQKEFYFNK